jgi:hypothetical protein
MMLITKISDDETTLTVGDGEENNKQWQRTIAKSNGEKQ